MRKFGMEKCLFQFSGHLGLILILFLFQGSSFAFQVGTAATLDPVVVHGVAGSFQASYKDLLRGVETFNKKHIYAPKSTLKFFVSDGSANELSPPLQLKFETRDSLYDVDLDEAKFFALPNPSKVNFSDSALLANRKKGGVELYPIVRTPADGSAVTRLADLRLECEVSWAIQKKAVPFYIRSAFFTSGRVCHSKHISVSFYSPRPLVSATMRSGQRTEIFPAGRDRHSYWIPVYDKSWPDDTAIEFKYLL